MAFLDKVSNMAKNIGDKTNVAIETQKLNSKINSEKNAIDGVFKKIGEYYFQQYKSGISLPEEAVALCAEIDGHNMAIDEAKAEIERIKAANTDAAAPAAASGTAAESLVCPSCGKANVPGTKFCQECGAKLEASDKRICSCGAEVAPGVRFCGSCGKPV